MSTFISSYHKPHADCVQGLYWSSLCVIHGRAGVATRASVHPQSQDLDRWVSDARMFQVGYFVPKRGLTTSEEASAPSCFRNVIFTSSKLGPGSIHPCIRAFGFSMSAAATSCSLSFPELQSKVNISGRLLRTCVASMMNLLSLPLELRDSIIMYSITSQARPVAIFEPSQHSGFEEPKDLSHVSRIGSKGIYYKLQPVNSPANLLLTNHQLQDETRAACERHRKSRGNTYKMDIILAHEDELACSWTQVPPLEKNVDVLEITFNIQGISLSSNKNGFMDNDGSTGSSIWRLYSIIERFLRCGSAPANKPDGDRGIALKELRINIPMPSKDNPANRPYSLADEEISPDKLTQHRKTLEKDNRGRLLHPEALAKFMYIWIEGLLRMSDASYALPGAPLAKYGRILLERLGTVTISVDGWENERFVVLPRGGGDAQLGGL